MLKTMTRFVAATALVALIAIPSAVAIRTTTGLWSSDFQATPTNCGVFSQDPNGFCYASTGEIVELGLRFTTSTPVNVLGVRIYRVSGGTVTGSLWDPTGTSLAAGTFDAYSGSHGWQDLVFSNPVLITPGNTYTASYHVPAGDYAFEYSYAFPTTVGPITALGGGVNGAYAYCDPGPCFPTASVGTNYWVTPLWVELYDFSGFFQPVDNPPAVNVVKAGQAIPVKFSLGGDQGLDVFAAGYPKSQQIACSSGTSQDDIEQTVTAGSSSLSYDAATDQYTYVWKTDKAWANSCRQLIVKLDDLTTHVASFQFKK